MHKIGFQVLLGAFIAFCAFGLGQTPSDRGSVGIQRTDPRVPPLRIESNLVVVPVFVFIPNGVERGTPRDEQCFNMDHSAFLRLRPDQPYLPRDCTEIEIRDLKRSDFRLFQDGTEQKIQSFAQQVDIMSVRDQPAVDPSIWHVETSDTQSGVWSSTDLNFFPDFGHHSYLLSYVPDNLSAQSGCHRIQVKVRRRHVEVFAKDEYCAGQTPSDVLNGTSEGKLLEKDLGSKEEGKIPLFLQVAQILNGSVDQHRVDVTLKFPWDQLDHSWDSLGKFKANIGIMGFVYSQDGRVVERFSDLLWPSWRPTYIEGWEEFADHFWLQNFSNGGDNRFLKDTLNTHARGWLPTRYEAQFDLSPGEYNLRVIISDGSKFGRAEASLTVASHDDKSLAVGSIVLCKRFRDAHVAAVEADAANFAPQYVPLVSKGVRFIPAGHSSFTPNEKMFAYFQIIDPTLESSPAQRIQAHIRIVGAQSGAVAKVFPNVGASTYEQPGSTIISIGREIPIDDLPKGQFRLEVQASDASGQKSPWQASAFSIH